MVQFSSRLYDNTHTYIPKTLTQIDCNCPHAISTLVFGYDKHLDTRDNPIRLYSIRIKCRRSSHSGMCLPPKAQLARRCWPGRAHVTLLRRKRRRRQSNPVAVHGSCPNTFECFEGVKSSTPEEYKTYNTTTSRHNSSTLTLDPMKVTQLSP